MTEPKSITKQTKWRCEIVDFGKAKTSGVTYFNPAIVRRQDGLWLIARRSQGDGRSFGFNDIMAFKLGEDWKPHYGQRVSLLQEANQEHMEDPRAVIHNGFTWISCTTFILQAETRHWTGAHQALFPVKSDWCAVTRFDPPFRGNNISVYACRENEKNWLWFFRNNEPYFIYLSRPHTVCRCNEAVRPVQLYETPDVDPPWDYGERRGGTDPILHDGLYWSFFHSSQPWLNGFRRYYMGAYAFEPDPPFRIVRMTKKPLLVGSQNDPWSPKKPLVVFPCGAILEGDSWIVSLGVNDLNCAIISIPHSDLLRRVHPVQLLTEVAA